jgi:hypothetical protein
MAKKSQRKATQAANVGANGHQRGAKSSAIRAYLSAHKGAMPKEVVSALMEQGISVSPNMVSIIKAKAGIKKANRKARQAIANGSITATQSGNAASLDAALTLYKAARGQQEIPVGRVRQAFLTLVEALG